MKGEWLDNKGVQSVRRTMIGCFMINTFANSCSLLFFFIKEEYIFTASRIRQLSVDIKMKNYTIKTCVLF